MSRHRSEPPADWLPSPDPAGYGMPDYPPPPGYQPGPEYPEAPPYPGYPADGSRAISHDEYGEDRAAYGVVADRDGAARHDPRPGGSRHDLRPGGYGVVYDDYGAVPEPVADGPRQVREPGGAALDDTGPGVAPRSDGDPASRSDGAAARWAMLGYLTVPLFGFAVPLLVYLRTLRGPSWSRAHAAQALNVWITAVLYGLSAVIMGTMLALDSPQIALTVFGPLVAGLWLVILTYLVRAATAASQGLPYTVPRWLCSPIVH